MDGKVSISSPGGAADRPIASPAELTFGNVQFHCAPDALVLRGISFRIGPGEKVAIVGPTGSGKTALIIAHRLSTIRSAHEGISRGRGIPSRQSSGSWTIGRQPIGPGCSDEYAGKTGRRIETAVQEGGHSEVNAAARLLQAMGEESNVTHLHHEGIYIKLWSHGKGCEMAQTIVGVRELKSRLSSYMRQVKAGHSVVITDHGKTIGRIIGARATLESRSAELIQAGIIAWSGRKIAPGKPAVRSRGKSTVADMVIENRN
jgi:prevent-host-death family protein